MTKHTKFGELIKELALEDPDILAAAKEVDQTLLDDFAELNLPQRVSWAEKTWHTVNGFKNVED